MSTFTDKGCNVSFELKDDRLVFKEKREFRDSRWIEFSRKYKITENIIHTTIDLNHATRSADEIGVPLSS